MFRLKAPHTAGSGMIDTAKDPQRRRASSSNVSPGPRPRVPGARSFPAVRRPCPRPGGPPFPGAARGDAHTLRVDRRVELKDRAKWDLHSPKRCVLRWRGDGHQCGSLGHRVELTEPYRHAPCRWPTSESAGRARLRHPPFRALRISAGSRALTTLMLAMVTSPSPAPWG
jgi:hypothetical protein